MPGNVGNVRGYSGWSSRSSKDDHHWHGETYLWKQNIFFFSESVGGGWCRPCAVDCVCAIFDTAAAYFLRFALEEMKGDDTALPADEISLQILFLKIHCDAHRNMLVCDDHIHGRGCNDELVVDIRLRQERGISGCTFPSEKEKEGDSFLRAGTEDHGMWHVGTNLEV